MVDDKQIVERVRVREAAKLILSIATEEVGKFQPHARFAFWKELLKGTLAALPPEYHPTRVLEHGPRAPMTDAEARQFDRVEIPFGKHVGRRVGDVPLDYLVWLDEQPDFRKSLNRYLRNASVRNEDTQPRLSDRHDR